MSTRYTAISAQRANDLAVKTLHNIKWARLQVTQAELKRLNENQRLLLLDSLKETK